MASKPFAPSRIDGRSDKQVVFDLVKDAPPDTLFHHDQLLSALKQGTERNITQTVVCHAVCQANRFLLRKQRRTLVSIRGMGYRVAHAKEHLPLAVRREDKALVQMRMGAEILDNVRVEELTPNERALHDGVRNLMAGTLLYMEALSKRLDKHDQMIAELMQKQMV